LAEELDVRKYSKMFASEAAELLQSLNDSMVQLERDPESKEVMEEMFRSFHTLKGMASMMNLDPVTDLAHALEDIMAAVRDGQLEPKGPVADGIFSGLDALDSMVKAFTKSRQVAENPKLMSALSELLKHAARKTATESPSEVEQGKKRAGKRSSRARKGERKAGEFTVKVKLARKCSLPSARAKVILRELAKVASVTSSSPSSDEIEEMAIFDELTATIVGSGGFEAVIKRIAAMSDVDEVLLGSKAEPMERWRVYSKSQRAPVTTEASPVQTVRVGMDKLDNLLDNIGELVIGRNRLLEKATDEGDFELSEISAAIDKLASDIQNQVLSIRMIPLDMMMARFHRMVRDMAKEQRKEVELVVEGGSIELDRTIVDKISDPIMHLIRNSMDHGVESPAERREAKKRPAGTIRIVASKQQDHVLIEVSDDGRGVDFEAIRRKAVEKRLMSKDEAQAALGRDLVDLLFQPGFSTKEEVTEVSGRGVGLDVVKSNVESLGGSVMMNTTAGAGTTFSLWLPFTLAIIDAMILTLGDQIYAMPMGSIVESHTFAPEEVKTIRGRDVVTLRGEVLPLVNLREFFGMDPVPAPHPINTLIVQSRDRRAALEVDDLLEHQEIVVKGLDERLRRVRGVSGGTILGRGNIALILDVDSILGA
jgi:two-component system chemotaxis sensor kinase CheA